jgi:2-iminoacetate synthase ThiH
MGSIMIEENVVSAAGAHNRATEETLRYLIKEAGFIPQQRDILYRYVSEDELPKNYLPARSSKRELKVMTVA